LEGLTMSNMMTINETADRWNISNTRIAKLCRENRIDGARKENGVWLIPENAQRPADGRIKSGAYVKEPRKPPLPLPIGISDYR